MFLSCRHTMLLAGFLRERRGTAILSKLSVRQRRFSRKSTIKRWVREATKRPVPS
jgi:hypothetical protein